MSLNGKVILVTGAGQGIGRGIALRLAKEGADLALADVKADKLDSVRKEVEALGRKATTVVADVEGVTARPDLDDAVVRVSDAVSLKDVVAVYVDNAAAESAVKAAVDVVDAADLGDEDAELTVGDVQDHDLAWYATQELPFLLELL